MKTLGVRASFLRVLPYLAAHRSAVSVGAGCLVLTNVMLGVIPWLMMEGINRLERQDPLASIGLIVLAIIATALVMTAIRAQSRLRILGASRRITYELRRDVFDHLIRVRLQELGRFATGDIMSRLTNDLRLVQALTGPGLLYSMNTVLAFATALGFMTALNLHLTIYALAPFPFFMATVSVLAVRLQRQQRITQERLADLSSRVQEDLNGISVIKAHAREEFATAAYETRNTAYTEANMKLVLIRTLLIPVMTMVGGAGALLVLLLGGFAVIDGSISLGGFVAFTGYLAMVAHPTIQMGWVITLFQRSRVALSRLAELSNLPAEPEGGGPADEPLAGTIDLRTATFRYPESRVPALEELSFTVPAGAFVGIYGPTGSGKSTIFRLLTRLHEPNPDQIFIDGKDVTTLPLTALRSSVAYVPQSPFLFGTTVRENIVFHDKEARDVEQAARDASIHHEITTFHQGYDTVVGERGITLSGGQRARIALARSLRQHSPILLLDDPFSAVDVETEHRILEGIRKRLAGATVLVATHRVKALRSADRILVVDRGRLVDSGSHEELLDRQGPYRRAFREQQLAEEIAVL